MYRKSVILASSSKYPPW